MSINLLRRTFFTAFSRLPILLILFASSACVAEEGTMDTTREFRICPADSSNEVVSTLLLEDVISLTTEQLLERLSGTDYGLENSRYGVSRYSCMPGEISPDKQVLVVSAGFDPTNTYVREFYVVADETGIVTQIELRKVRLGP